MCHLNLLLKLLTCAHKHTYTHTLSLSTLEIEYPKVSYCTRLDERNGIIRTAVKHLAVSAFLQHHTGTRKQERRLTHHKLDFIQLTGECTHTHTHIKG